MDKIPGEKEDARKGGVFIQVREGIYTDVWGGEVVSEGSGEVL